MLLRRLFQAFRRLLLVAAGAAYSTGQRPAGAGLFQAKRRRESRMQPATHFTGRRIAMDLGLKGLKAIVTGGTRGIGHAVATLLASEGCDVAICARNGAAVDEAVATLARSGVRATGGAVDVADLPALRGWIAEAADSLGGLDIFIANVSALAQGMDEDSWRRGFEIDVMSTVFGIEAALPLLERSDAASIVAVGSTAMAEIYGPTRSYAAVKAALLPYIKGLARNLAPKNIRANVVSPGNVFFTGGVWDVVRQRNPEMFAQTLARNPMGRMGTPEEVANAVAFLASPRASFITGTNLIIDGALTQRVQF
jgi:NAD(P)-dependent dehydrogenase (short-subunit alcohol dehydrogenase family)